jgi:hypothetical protein
MSESGWELGLADADNAGVYFVTTEDLDTLGVAGRDAGLQVRRVDLDGGDKHQILLRIATALDFPRTFGHNWDAWPTACAICRGCRTRASPLLFENGGALQQAEGDEFDTLLEILEQTAQEWSERDVPFWSFIALPESVFDEIDAQASE